MVLKLSPVALQRGGCNGIRNIVSTNTSVEATEVVQGGVTKVAVRRGEGRCSEIELARLVARG